MNYFDYVIVGAGSAGCVVAARLTEDSNVRVLLLEAGGEDTSDLIHVPSAWPALWGTEFDWNYSTEPQAGTFGSVHSWPRGKVLGGSSSINAMVYLRGHRNDFDRWEREGAAGWGYSGVLPFFRRMEHVPGNEIDYRGRGGPITPSVASDPNPLSQIFLDAAAELSYPMTQDFNGSVQEGAGWHELLIADGKRMSAAAAYLHPISGRPNLTVVTGARARRLLFQASRCVGVEYVHDGELTRVGAEAEVIVCAGAVDSPKLLLASGIGPAEHLREVGVEVINDLPGVGRNLHDHPLLGYVVEASREIPAGTANHAEVSMLWRSDPGLPGPDMQFMFIHVPFHPPTLQSPANSYTIGIATVPRSRGWIKLSSPDPDAPPVINPNYLDDDYDVQRLLLGIERARELNATRAFSGWRDKEILPGRDVLSEKELRRFIAQGTGTYYHPVGTCKMGVDDMSVVNPHLQVHGMTGLRVADASVMPTIVSVNTNAATLMIGEKASSIIRGDRLFADFRKG
ncbi:GMC family oxidoreductase N-terminal domain-containing protein [Streptomyces sp. TRM75561]|uniref:GMC family oxidoreductase n=1 Tax=Streptomyces sp. TRM75561 TaxID=2975269 RepID=UPI0024496C48|nr:GMC family oxidoreductase N-terminal domain-containing protein [Streptomyces sp. TRM75561]MDH3039079.1 GMC family oxidoreductase N-terminal domain-containing protein [Streptomyces sp. TRM75561]